ncbi:ELKS/Rab6-interacting/CAST family member 1-like [Sceloporus undulatus]|uniref:ELKS/Rab6-interacting/CAST family member 1-like n=1 Tax=Sceloporus undulatus TaxID=8520 RepID=UPI001C4D04E5|nr:ELKS/Rab6-interacting/CAST family member 1-like [Sceloporus undulatus]
MERGLRDLEEEIQMLKSNGALSTEEREEEMKQMEVYRSHSKFMKNKVEQLKEELNAKEAQGEELKKKVTGLQTEVSAVRLTSLCAVPLTWALLAFLGSSLCLTYTLQL